MKKCVRRVSVVCCAVLMLSAVAPVLAQAPAAGSASEFYLKYRKVFEGAKKIEELMPYMSAATLKQVESTPPEERSKMFELVKLLGEITDMKIVKETPTATGATLTVEGIDSDKAKTTGTIEIVKEGGGWKIGKESWSTKS